MIELLSRKICLKIKRWDSDSKISVEVLSYALGHYINLYGIIIISLIIGLITQEFFGTVVAIVGFAALRKYSGGFHLNLTSCAVLCIAMFSIFPHMSIGRETVIMVNMASLILVAMHATKKPIAIFIVCSNFFILSEPLALTFLAQSLTLLPYRGGERHEKNDR